MKTNHPFFIPAPAYKISRIICSVKHLAVLCFALSVFKIQVDFLWFSHNYYLLGLTEVYNVDILFTLQNLESLLHGH